MSEMETGSPTCQVYYQITGLSLMAPHCFFFFFSGLESLPSSTLEFKHIGIILGLTVCKAEDLSLVLFYLQKLCSLILLKTCLLSLIIHRNFNLLWKVNYFQTFIFLFLLGHTKWCIGPTPGPTLRDHSWWCSGERIGTRDQTWSGWMHEGQCPPHSSTSLPLLSIYFYQVICRVFKRDFLYVWELSFMPFLSKSKK